jgi:Holliday junction resolvase
MGSKFKAKVIKEYESNGHIVIGLIRGSKNGYADLIAIKEGETTFIECKEKTDTVSKLQLYRGREVEKFGAKFILLQDRGDRPFTYPMRELFRITS